MDFNTDQDMHTIMQYTKQVYKDNGFVGVIKVNIHRLADLHEDHCKKLTLLIMLNMGMTINKNKGK